MIRIWPANTGESNGSIGYKECSKSESVTHQEIPHHQFSILNIEWASSTTPPLPFNWYCLSHVIVLDFSKIDLSISLLDPQEKYKQVHPQQINKVPIGSSNFNRR